MPDAASPLLQSPCSIFSSSLWLTRARLYRTHIELSGWTWSGRVLHRIPLPKIAHIRWWGGKEDVNLELTLNDDRIVALYLREGVGIWNYTLRRFCKNCASPSSAGGMERTTLNRVGLHPL